MAVSTPDVAAGRGLGTAISLQDEQPNFAPSIIGTMRQADKEIGDAMRAKKAQALQLKKDQDKYSEELNNYIVKADAEMLPMRHDAIKTYAQKVRDLADQAWNEGKNPKSDSKVLQSLLDMQAYSNDAKSEYKRFTTDIGKIQTLHPEDRTVDEELLGIYGGTDPEKAIEFQTKKAQGTGLEHLVNPYGWYQGGSYTLNDQPKDFLGALQTSAGKLGQQLVKVEKVDGKDVRVSTATPEQIAIGWDSFSAANPIYQKYKKNAVKVGELNPSTGEAFKDEKEVDSFFGGAYTASVKQSYANMAEPISIKMGEKMSAEMFSSPYSSKGKGTPVNGINIGFKGSNKGIKADLQSGKEVLKDVDLKTIFNAGTTDKPNLRATVMERIVEEREMTPDERKAEKSLAAYQLRQPIYTKTTTIEKPKEIDFNIGSNNYNTIIEQYPPVKDYIDALLKGASTKTPAKSYSIKGKPYTHQQLNDMGYTDEQITAAQKAGTIK